MLSKEKEEEESNKLSLLMEHFQWIRVLGEGTFGKVYLIRNKNTKKEYALKQYNRNQLQKHNKYRSLIRSLYIMQRLSHPNIIRCINYIVPPDEDLAIYTIYESCKRGSLDNIKRHLRSQRLYSIIKLILYDLAEGLSYLKQQNVAHRDLKPSNITFNSSGQLKIIDFDEAVCFDQKLPNMSQFRLLKDFGANLSDALPFAKASKSRASNYVGTLFYMAPEMIQSTICDEKSDLWAYGCIVYEILVGQYLHIEFDTQQLFQHELEARLKSFAQACPDHQALGLFKSIAHYNPQQRIEIDEVILHPYFDEIREKFIRDGLRERFARFLRGNFNISKEKSYNTYGIDGLSLERGTEVYRQLKTMILLQVGEAFQFFEIISGPFYFKFKDCKNRPETDFYVRYDKVDRIVRNNDLLSLYFYSDMEEEVLEERSFKHFYPELLETLHRLLDIVIKQ